MVMAKANMPMLMVIPSLQIDGEGKVEDACVDGYRPVLIDGKGEVKDADDDSSRSKLTAKVMLATLKSLAKRSTKILAKKSKMPMLMVTPSPRCSKLMAKALSMMSKYVPKPLPKCQQSCCR